MVKAPIRSPLQLDKQERITNLDWTTWFTILDNQQLFAGLKGLRIPITPTASLPAPSQEMDGQIVIEDTGTGYNIIAYAGGNRYTLGGVGSLPQSIDAGASPTFVTVKLSGLSDGYIPYHVSDTVGLANGPTKADVDSAVSLKHAAVAPATTVIPETSYSITPSVGTYLTYAREDHTHGTPVTPITAVAIPIGGIIGWSGLIASIPTGFAICDGAANSPGPDLTDIFVA